tara:strand:- start:1655 stop:2140 length:486 start_codon:yes stop_codon:yes gene_type:complete
MKKSQIKMTETIAVLIIFFFLLVFGFTFYTKIQKTSFARDTERNADLKAIALTQKAAFLPELQCTFRNIQTDNCFDELKINAFIAAMNNPNTKDFYLDTFGFSEITLDQLDIDGSGAQQFSLYTNPKLESLFISTINVPVTIYNPIDKKYKFAQLLVKSYG